MTTPQKANIVNKAISNQGSAEAIDKLPVKPSDPPTIPPKLDPPLIYPILTLAEEFTGDIASVEKILDLSGFPFSEEQVIAYQSELGLFPEGGPAALLEDRDYLRSHIESVKEAVDSIIPDANYDGYIIIDYEDWSLLWHRTEKAYQQEWISAWEKTNPQGVAAWRDEGDEIYWHNIAATYNAMTRAFYTATIQQCKAMRPGAKWGFYQQVFKPIMVDGTAAKTAMEDNEDISWLFEASDFICPSLLSPFETVSDGTTKITESQQTVTHRKEIIKETLKEASKYGTKYNIPVIPLFWTCHNGATLDNYQKFCSVETMRATLDSVYENSPHDIFLWYPVSSEIDADAFMKHLTSDFMTALQLVWREHFGQGTKDDDDKIVQIPVEGGYITPDKSFLVFHSDTEKVQARMKWEEIDEAKKHIE